MATLSTPRAVQVRHSLIAMCFLLYLTICSALSIQQPLVSGQSATNPTNTTVLDVFQVYKPPISPPANPSPCTQLLMQHTFAFSYGQPFIGSYTPPSCPFNSITLNLTVTSSGRQFDRLALMYLSDTEVFRTSTAEPTVNGIIWSYTKDISAYLPLWKEPQKIIFDLGNLIDDTYTGSFNVTLTATFWLNPTPPVSADKILPISAQQSSVNGTSAFVVPQDNATTSQVFPPGVHHAIVSLAACGQATEEFWYSNVLSSDIDTFNATTGELYGYSPFREVQLLIDGMLAGVVWPFPIIFTGGIAPGFWRPIVGIDAFDLREGEIDISPFVAYLSDREPHTFQIKVVGLRNDANGVPELSNEVGDNWVVSGKIFLFIDASYRPARIMPPDRGTPKPFIQTGSTIGRSSNGTNETLAYSVQVNRNVWIQFDGNYWYQNLRYSNNGLLTGEGVTQVNTQSTTGALALYHPPLLGGKVPGLRSQTTFEYPLVVNTTYGTNPDGSILINAELNRGLTFFSEGRPDISTYTLVSGPAALATTQYGSAEYSSQTNKSFSAGDTRQDFWQGSQSGSYARDVEAVNGTLVRDLLGQGGLREHPFVELRVGDIRSMIGRGPGRPRGLRR